MTPETPSQFPWLDHLDDGVVLIAMGRVVYLNRTAARLLEVEPAHALGQPVISVFRDHRLEQAYVRDEALELETRGRILLARPMPGGVALRDLTELRRSQESARELLAVLSHELRTPATTIRATLEALRFDLPEVERRRFLARAEEEAERLIRLLEDLTVDVKPPQLRRVPLREVAERALALLQDTFARYGVEVRSDLPPLTVWADTDKLVQVLVNLLENAAIHGPDHRAVHLSAELDPQDASRVLVRVRDEGEPLAPEVIERLFEPHTRGAPAKARGSGLGLYIVRSIARRWGGCAWGRPLEDGNEFGFSVPVKV